MVMAETDKSVKKAAKTSVKKAVTKSAKKAVKAPVETAVETPVKQVAAEPVQKAKSTASKPVKMLSLTLIRSRHHRLASHKACVAGLGLRRMHQTVQVIDTPENRGMVNRVHYLLKVEEV